MAPVTLVSLLERMKNLWGGASLSQSRIQPKLLIVSITGVVERWALL